MAAKEQSNKKRANVHNSRKGTNGKPTTAKHNDRDFDVKQAAHIESELVEKNIYWRFLETEKKAPTLDEYEQQIYEKNFSDMLTERNETQIKARHKNRVQTMEQFRRNAKFCPEESLLTIGNRNNKIDGKILEDCFADFIKWHTETYPNVLLLDAALHRDEPNATDHIHLRKVWTYQADGHLAIGQAKALEEMGIERPDLTKKETRNNNAKMTYTAQVREKWLEIAEQHGIEIEKEPQEKSRNGLTLLQLKKRTLEEQITKLENDIAVLDSEYESRTEIDKKLDKEIADKEKQLSKKTAELDGINARIAEAKNIVMTKDIPPRPDVKELPENPTRKDKKEHEKELQAAKEWDEKYKEMQAVQIVANNNQGAANAIRQQMKINAENETKNKKMSEHLNREIKKFQSKIAQNNLRIEKEVERRLAPHNFAERQRQEDERYLQKQRSLFAENLDYLREQGKAEQERKQQLFEKAKYKTTKKTKGDFEK